MPLPGDFGVVGKQKGARFLDVLFGDLIRFDTDSPVNHAFVYVGNNQIVEAVRHVKISYASQYTNIIWSTDNISPEFVPSSEQREAIVNVALSHVGDDYNILDIFAIGLAQKRVGHLINSKCWIAKRLSNDHKLICSQLVDVCYKEAGIQLFSDGRLPGLVSPGDLYKLLTSSGPV